MEALERNVIPTDWITLVLLLCFILLALTKWSYPYRFQDFIMLFINDKYLLVKGRESRVFDTFNILFFPVSVISVSLFIFIIYKNFGDAGIIRPGIIFIRIATAYGAFVLLKFSVEKIVSNVLSIDREMDHFLFCKMSYRNFFSMLLLPLNLIFLYILPPDLTVVLIIFGLFLLLQIIIVIDLLKKNQQFIFKNLFYFILYLCALEIGPYFILYKVIT